MRRASVLSRVVVAGLIAAGGAATVRGADPPPRRPEVWALVIGIERYRDEAIPRGRGAVRDSQAIARWLRQAAGWGAGHVLELNDAGDPRPGRPEAQVAALRPTRENLAWAASQWLGARVRPGDVVVVWYSGQVAGRAGRAYLLPIDARTIDVENTGWLLDGALDELAARGQNRILYWLDTSLQGRGRPVAPPPVRPGAPADEPPSGAHWLDQLARWPGVSAWLAAEGHPAAEGADGPGPGPFAAALLEALGTPERPRSLTSCLARLRRDGRVTAQGFRARGGIPPELTLWSRAIQPPAQLRPELLLQRGHAGGITAVAVTPDGSQMITASLDTTVRIWRVADRTLLRVLPYHRLGATSLALSPDGRWLASGDNFGRVQVWDLVTQGPRSPPVPQPHAAGIAALAALPGGTRLVSLDREGTALLWDVSGLVLRAQPLLPAGAPASLRIAGAMEEGGVAVALAGSDDKVRLFDASGRPGPTLDGPGGAVTAVDLAADGRRLAVGDETGRVDVWEVGDPQREPSRVVRTQSPEPGEVGVLRLAADRK
ncbi:MAG TPA: caspase family protein, partial [Isosphaeraceae bacterium]